jgi:L-fuconolactonase
MAAGVPVDEKAKALSALTRVLAVDDEWLSQYEEPVVEPELMIIDAHHHLWGAPRQLYQMDEFSRDLATGHNVVATVHVECHENYRHTGPAELHPVGETEFLAAAAEQFSQATPRAPRVCAGIVGHADLTAGACVQAILEAHISAGQGRFRGVRQSSAWDPHPEVRTTIRSVPEGLLLDSRFRAGFAHLAPLGLTFDVWAYHPQLGEVANLARAFPDTRIVLDHTGGPIGISVYAQRRTEVMEDWRQGIAEVAKCPNVSVKLGGLGMRLGGFGFDTRPKPPSSVDLADAWRPFVQGCLEAFGPHRAMFESNFPADKPTCSYAVLWNAFKRLAHGCTSAEKADLFSGTAMRIYSLDL